MSEAAPLLRRRVRERAGVGWAWRGAAQLSSAFPPGLHGDRTRPAPAPALARPAGAAAAAWRRWGGPRERRVQVTVARPRVGFNRREWEPGEPREGSLSPLPHCRPLCVHWSPSGASLAALCSAEKVLEEPRDEVSTAGTRGVTPSHTSRAASRGNTLCPPFGQFVGTVGQCERPKAPELRLAGTPPRE